jgi:hypothetical protein
MSDDRYVSTNKPRPDGCGGMYRRPKPPQPLADDLQTSLLFVVDRVSARLGHLDFVEMRLHKRVTVEAIRIRLEEFYRACGKEPVFVIYETSYPPKPEKSTRKVGVFNNQARLDEYNAYQQIRRKYPWNAKK